MTKTINTLQEQKPPKDFFSWDEEVDGKEIVIVEPPKSKKQIEVESFHEKIRNSVYWIIQFLVPGKHKLIVQEEIAWQDATGKTVTILRTETIKAPEPAPPFSRGIFRRLKWHLHVTGDENFTPRTPLFSLIICFLDLVAFVVSCFVKDEFGIHQPVVGPDAWQFKLVGAFPECVDTRHELWRWVTYQFCHVGWPNTLINLLLQLLLGGTLEGMYGTLRVLIVYQSGIVVGGLTCAVVDVYRTVIGASAGLYALFGMNVANLFLQRGDIREGVIPRLCIITSFIVFELLCFLYYKSGDVSFAAHGGGFVWGFFAGLALLRNFKNKILEYLLAWFSFSALVLYLFFSVSWTIDHWLPENWSNERSYGAQPHLPCCWQPLPLNGTKRQWYSCWRNCQENEFGVTNECEYSLFYEGAPPSPN